MYKIKIFSIGKTKESWLEEALSEYEKRLQSLVSFEWALAKNNEQLERLIEKCEHFICLDPMGTQYTSEQFSLELIRSLTEGGSRFGFVIGGAEGIPASIKKRARGLLSFSKMVFTHQISRLILVEQIYRALEIVKGSRYHK